MTLGEFFGREANSEGAEILLEIFFKSFCLRRELNPLHSTSLIPPRCAEPPQCSSGGEDDGRAKRTR